MKNELLDDLEKNNYDIKRPNKNKKKKNCPLCGNKLKAKLISGFLFCQSCHKRISGKIYDFDTSVKDMNL